MHVFYISNKPNLLNEIPLLIRANEKIQNEDLFLDLKAQRFFFLKIYQFFAGVFISILILLLVSNLLKVTSSLRLIHPFQNIISIIYAFFTVFLIVLTSFSYYSRTRLWFTNTDSPVEFVITVTSL